MYLKKTTSLPLESQASNPPLGGGHNSLEVRASARPRGVVVPDHRSGIESLPRLSSNNGIQTASKESQEKAGTILGLCNLLSPYHKRQAHTLFSNVHRLVTKVAPSPGHVGFLTLTFPDNLTDNRKVRERFRSFNTNYLSCHDSIKEWISTKEVQKRGAWHFHLVVVLTQDISTGIIWEDLEKGIYKSASPFLRDLWRDLRESLPKYGFGRSELLPVKSGPDAIARYVGKYISKHISARTDEHKGVRLVNYSTGWLRNSSNFAWNNQNSQEWRRKLKKFAAIMGCDDFYDLTRKLGPHWAYNYCNSIFDIDDLHTIGIAVNEQGLLVISEGERAGEVLF